MTEPTISDVLRELGVLRDEQQALRRVVLDEIAGLRHYVHGLDRDISTLVRRYSEGEDDE